MGNLKNWELQILEMKFWRQWKKEEKGVLFVNGNLSFFGIVQSGNGNHCRDKEEAKGMLKALYFEEITRAAIFYCFIIYIFGYCYYQMIGVCSFCLGLHGWPSKPAILQHTFKTKVGLNINSTSVISS